MLVAVKSINKLPLHIWPLCRSIIHSTSPLRTRHSSPTPPKLPPGNSSKANQKPTKLLLSTIRSFIETAQDSKLVNGLVKRKLDEYLPLTSEPHITYGKVISILVNNHFLEEATIVYQRMVGKGFIPSSETRSQMLAVMLTQSDSSAEDIRQMLDAIISDPAYSEDRLLRLLHLMAKLGISYEKLLYVARQFLETRSDGYSPSQALVTKLVDAQVRAGQLEDAFETLIQNDYSPAPQTTDPYATLITALNDTRPSDDASLESALQLMKESGLNPDISIFNALISRMHNEGSFSKVFSLYGVIKKLSNTTSLTPNASTFRFLFSTWTRLYNSGVRNRRLRRFKFSIDVLPRRRVLYRDLTAYHSRVPLEISSATLNTILRSFMVHNDYPGAFVILRSFSLFGANITAGTYFIIMRHIMSRLRIDTKSAREAGKLKWGDRFLGITRETDIEKLDIDEMLTGNILAFARCSVFDLSRGFLGTPPDGDIKYTTPTLEMIDGEVPAPRNMSLDVVPLQRLLRCAILANIATPCDRPAWHVSDAIVRAKAEMVFDHQRPQAKKPA